MSVATQANSPNVVGLPDMKVSIGQLFGFDSAMEVPAYSEPDEHVPEIDQDYRAHGRPPSKWSVVAPSAAISSGSTLPGGVS